MFFESSDFDLKILAVLYDDRYPHNGNSGMRPFYALSYRIEGDALFTFNNKNLYVKDNDLLICPKNYAYDIDAGREKLFIVHFDTNSKLPETLKKISVTAPKIFEREFLRLYAAWTAKRIGYEHECKYILHKIFMYAERECDKKYTKADQLSVAVDYIHDHFCDEEINISKLANLCSMSDTYFRKIFKKQFSITPLKYINRLRTERAAELLQSGYYTVTETAEKCGFENVYYFSLFIKKETGKTPSQICSINDK